MTIKNLSFLKITIFVVVFQIFYSCKEDKLVFNGKVYKIENNIFGYEVIYKGTVFIKQENIPAIEENKKFTDSIDALKTLDLVLKKLNSGQKPTLTLEEIKKLNLKIE
jgi:Domain of unknown function (DUF4907)